MKLLVDSGIANELLPAIPPLGDVPQPLQYHPEGDVLRHTSLVLAFLPEPVTPDLAWTAVFHDVGKLQTFELAEDRIRFNDHDRVSAEMGDAWLQEHGASSDLKRRVGSLIREHIRFASLPGFKAAKRRAFLENDLWHKHHAFHFADCMASHRKLDIYELMGQRKAELPPGHLEPLIRGKDLMALGFSPSPAMGQLLQLIAERRAEGLLQSRDDALEFAVRWKDDR